MGFDAQKTTSGFYKNCQLSLDRFFPFILLKVTLGGITKMPSHSNNACFSVFRLKVFINYKIASCKTDTHALNKQASSYGAVVFNRRPFRRQPISSIVSTRQQS
jgi:hypothetical protein